MMRRRRNDGGDPDGPDRWLGTRRSQGQGPGVAPGESADQALKRRIRETEDERRRSSSVPTDTGRRLRRLAPLPFVSSGRDDAENGSAQAAFAQGSQDSGQRVGKHGLLHGHDHGLLARSLFPGTMRYPSTGVHGSQPWGVLDSRTLR